MRSLIGIVRKGVRSFTSVWVAVFAGGSMAFAAPQSPPSTPPSQAQVRADPVVQPIRTERAPPCSVIVKKRIVKVPRMILKNGVVFGTVDVPVEEKYLTCEHRD